MRPDTKPTGILRPVPCTYGLSKVFVRGPRKRTDGPYAAFVGGTDTFGKYIPTPFPDLLEAQLGETCVNLGVQSAGPDVFLYDTAIASLCHDAQVTVIQVLSAANVSNRFYKVHPRRNDRFVGPTEALTSLYPDVDFSQIAFTGHLIQVLRDHNANRFADVEAVLQATWLRRMKSLVGQCGGAVLLLWFAADAPETLQADTAHPANDPLLVTREMIEALRAYVTDIVEVAEPRGDATGMSYPPLEEANTRERMTVEAHWAAAKALALPMHVGFL